MPGRTVHSQIGIVTGAAAAALVAPTHDPLRLAIEIASGGLGGYLGGLAPDAIEPAVSSHHRNLAHSVVAGAAVVMASFVELQAHCRTAGSACEQRALALTAQPDEAARARWEALAWHALAALLVGFAAGYVSHLALDSGTPRSIPLLFAR